MQWLEMAVVATAADVELVAEVMGLYFPQGLAVEEGLVRDGAAAAVVKAYLPAQGNWAGRRRSLRRALRRLPLSAPLPPIRVRPLEPEDWAEGWKRFFPVQRVAPSLVICPSWRRYRARPGEVVVRLDPGMSFGTGDHPTTRMCLTALERLLRPGMQVLDLGTGSGILALAAARLGAGHVLALDIDPQAVAVARRNVARNRLARRVRVEQGSLGRLWPPSLGPRPAFHLVVANISAAAVTALAPELAATLLAKGTLIASGVVAEHQPEVGERLRRCGLLLEEVMTQGDWRAFIARKP